jgi:hypothetical protein
VNVSCNQAEKCPETEEDKCKAYAECALTTSMTSLFGLGIYKLLLAPGQCNMKKLPNATKSDGKNLPKI